MRELYLIRHASPQVQPNVPSPEWALSERGIEEARALAETAASWGLAAVYCSVEPKARSTALILAEGAGLPVSVLDGGHELRIDDWIANADRFNEIVRAILDDPEAAQRGAESAADAAARFAAAIALVEAGPFPAALVSHGRVLTAYLSSRFEPDDPFAYWRAIPMPAWARLDLDAPSLPEFRS